MSTTASGDSGEHFQPVAALLALILPGAGQIYLGYVGRGLTIFAGIMGLFLGGLLVGGLNSIDSRENRVWFIGQALVGPTAFILDNLHQSRFKGYETSPAGQVLARPSRVPNPDETITRRADGIRVLTPLPAGERPPIVKSIGRPNEIGTLFGAIAGMLNVIAIIDAAWSIRRRDREARARAAAPPAPGTPPTPAGAAA
jgi:TM2 domain-containing membrane protein YozV